MVEYIPELSLHAIATFIRQEGKQEGVASCGSRNLSHELNMKEYQALTEYPWLYITTGHIKSTSPCGMVRVNNR